MKFEKPQSARQPTLVTTDDVILANKFEERRARERRELEGNGPGGRYDVKVDGMLKSLSRKMDVTYLKRSNLPPMADAGDIRDERSARQAALDHLETLRHKYVNEPLS